MSNILPERIKTLWVQALRSGKYEQGIGALRCNDAHCCLGVLCEIYSIENPEIQFESGENNLMLHDGTATLPSDRVMIWANLLEEEKSEYRCMDVQDVIENKIYVQHISILDHLWKMNDIDGKKFTEIADWIEEKL